MLAMDTAGYPNIGVSTTDHLTIKKFRAITRFLSTLGRTWLELMTVRLSSYT